MSRKKVKKNRKFNLISVILILLAFLYGSFFEEINGTFGMMYDNINKEVQEKYYGGDIEAVSNIDDYLKIYFLDVGQADSILITLNDEAMLIDAGNNSDGTLLVKYFQELGINEFKYVVGTHPHEDHIGGLDDIVDAFNIETIYIPDAITTTATFEDLLDALERKNMRYDVPKIDSTFNLGDAQFKVIYTGTDTNDLNNTSIVLKMTFGNTSYLFTGDMTGVVEKKILNKDITADVLKVGHHGSKYSSTDDFLKKVNPRYAIISVGKNNIYDHPSVSSINKFRKLNIDVYRTDNDGTILLESDGINIKFSKINTDTDGGKK